MVRKGCHIFFEAFIFALLFFYGTFVGIYKIFPYQQMMEVARVILPKEIITQRYSICYENKKSFFEKHGQNNCDIVFIGDSITDEAEWSEMFPGLKIANRGIGGDTTDGLINRIDSISSTNARKAFIMMGINDFDLGSSVDNAFNNYSKSVISLKNKGMHVYVQSTILAGGRKRSLNKKIKELNDLLERFSLEQEGVTYVDLNSSLSHGGALSPQFSIDDVHLNGEGYAVWKTLIKDLL